MKTNIMNNLSEIREIWHEYEAEIEFESNFQDFATPIIREKFNNPNFNFSFIHLCSDELKNFVKELRLTYKN